MRAGGQFGGVDRAVLTFVLLFEFFDAHVRRGLVRLGRGRTVVLGSHTSRIDTRTLNLHGHPAAAGGVRPGAARASSVNPPARRFRRWANCPWRAVTRQRFQRAGPSPRGVHQLCLKDDRRAVSVYCDVRREKAPVLSGCEPRPATVAPAGSSRSG